MTMKRTLVIAALAVATFVVGRPFQGRLVVGLDAQQKGKSKFNTWRQYLGGSDSSQYSSLDQINKKNIAQIQVAWTYPVGDMRTYRFNRSSSTP